MSIKIMDRAFEAQVQSPIARLVLVKLADNADDFGKAFPSIARIARQTSLSIGAVKKHLKQLAADGFISIGKWPSRNGYQRNVYRLNFKTWPMMPPFRDVDDDDDDSLGHDVTQQVGHHMHQDRSQGEPGVGHHVTANRHIEPSSNQDGQNGHTLFDKNPPEGIGTRENIASHAMSGSNGHSAAQIVLDAEFAQFWEAYPKRQARGAALKAFRAARKIATLEQILNGVERYKAADPSRPLTYTKNPATWLNGQCWGDEHDVPQDAPSYPMGETDYQRRHREWRDNGRKGPQPQPNDKIA